MFDFHPTSSLVHMQVQENSEISRFEDCAVPKWFGTKLTPPDFTMTQNVNNIKALIHLNKGDCSIVPISQIVDYRRCTMDIDRNLLFVKISCASVHEARKRAIVLAYLTYDLTRHIFVKLNSAQML